MVLYCVHCTQYTAVSNKISNIQAWLFVFALSFRLFPGAAAPEESAPELQRQVCVGGEPVHHGGRVQLLRRGGLPTGGQGAGEDTQPNRGE